MNTKEARARDIFNVMVVAAFVLSFVICLYLTIGTPVDPATPLKVKVITLEQWCDDNPNACDDVGHKRLFVDLEVAP